MKVAIIGGSPSSQMLAPFDDKEWDIWVLGNQLDQYKGKRITRIFEIHDDLSEHNQGYDKWLVEHNIYLVVSDKFPVKGEHIRTYPESEINELMGGCLSSSPAYMMGMAILEGYDEIGIYGVDMAVDNHEYFKQRPEMYAWIGLAKGKGIKITIPEESSLFKGMYTEGRDWGIKDDNAPFSEKELLNLADIHNNEIAACRQQISDLECKINAHDGARQVYERLAKVARSISSGVDIKTLTETVRVI